MESLWSTDINDINVSRKAPITILKMQASMLGQMTQNLVICDIRVHSTFEYGEIIEPDSGKDSFVFSYDFYIRAPAICDYRYKLLTISYNIDFYPIYFCLDKDVKDEIFMDNISEISTASEELFLELLKKIFHSTKVKKVVSAILSQIIIDTNTLVK